MIHTTDPDEVLIATPSRTITWDGERPLRIFGRTLFWRRVRERFVVHAPSLGELTRIESDLRVADALGLAACVEVIAGSRAASTPYQVQQAIFDAHFEVAYPPKAKAAAVSPSAEEPSSAASAPGTDTALSTSSA